MHTWAPLRMWHPCMHDSSCNICVLKIRLKIFRKFWACRDKPGLTVFLGRRNLAAGQPRPKAAVCGLVNWLASPLKTVKYSIEKIYRKILVDRPIVALLVASGSFHTRDRVHMNSHEFMWTRKGFRFRRQSAATAEKNLIHMNSWTRRRVHMNSHEFNGPLFGPVNSCEFRSKLSSEFTWVHMNSPKKPSRCCMLCVRTAHMRTSTTF